MEKESLKLFKEYSEATIVEKEELQAMKSCFEELHTFLSMQSDILFFGSQNQGGEVLMNFQAAGKRNYMF